MDRWAVRSLPVVRGSGLVAAKQPSVKLYPLGVEARVGSGHFAASH